MRITTSKIDGQLWALCLLTMTWSCSSTETRQDATASGPDSGSDSEPDSGSPDSGSSVGDSNSADSASAEASAPVPLPTCVVASTLPTWRQSMTAGQWKVLDSADISQVTPPVQPGGYYSARIEAWNGFAADRTTSRMYLGAAGGHADYAGNEVYTIDLTAESPQWVMQSPPSPASAYLIDQPYYSDGKPSPTHTYWTSWFIEQRHKLFRFAGAGLWGTGNGGTDRIDSWNPATQSWDPEGTNPRMGPSPLYEMPTAKDFATGDVYQFQSNNHLYRWNQDTNTVTDLGEAGGGSGSFYDLYKSPLVVDGSQRLLFLSDDSAPAGSIRIYDITAKTWSTKALQGAAAPAVAARESQGMAFYDFCASKIIFKTITGGSVYWLDPATLAATALVTSGASVPDAINGVHTLFQSLPSLGGYAYQPKHASKLHFLATQ